MDLREHVDDLEEVIRACVLGHMKGAWTAMPALVTADTTDGHVAVVQPTIKRAVTDLVTGALSFEDHPDHPDQPIHYAGGGKVVATHPIKQGDEGLQIFASRCIDAWHQSGQTQQPMEDRLHSLADGVLIPGIRSDPRKLAQVDNDAHHVRSVDKKHVAETHPDTGHHVKSADPATPPASATFDPFKQATKFAEHLTHPTAGVAGNVTDGGTTHSHGVTHDDGAFMRALNALHTVLAHPTDGASMNASNLLHSVKAHPDLGALLSAMSGEHLVQAHPKDGVMIMSATKVAISAPPGGLSLPSGGVSSDALGENAASDNVGALGGDLAATLPNPHVVGIGHVANANTLPVAASDAAAAGEGVVVGGLYVNTTAVQGVNLLAVRMA